MSRSSRIAIISTIVSTLGGTSALAQSPKLPLAIERAVTSNGTGAPGEPMRLTLELKNIGTRDITAWAYLIEMQLDDGTIRREPRSSDVLPATEPSNYIVSAKGRRSESVFLGDIRPEEVRGITVRMTAVIFDDATASGDDKVIGAIFARRDHHRQTWNALHGMLTEARAQYSDPFEVLQMIKSEIDAADPTVREAGDVVLARKWVVSALQSAQLEAAERTVSQLARVVGEHRDLFEKQSSRRPAR